MEINIVIKNSNKMLIKRYQHITRNIIARIIRCSKRNSIKTGHLKVIYGRKGSNECDFDGLKDLRTSLNCFLEKDLIDHISQTKRRQNEN